MGVGAGSFQHPPGPLGQLNQGLAQPAFLCFPTAPSPPTLEAMVGSGISYLLRSQILRGEKCPQQAVPVTKELPNKRRAVRSGLSELVAEMAIQLEVLCSFSRGSWG